MDAVITYFICILIVLFITFLMRVCAASCRSIEDRRPRRVLCQIRVDPILSDSRRIIARDRQGNIFSISDEASTNAGANRYPDFFYLEPSSDEAARIRAQLEKDDKDLPSYEDVIRMTSPPATPMTPPPAVALPAIGTTTTSNVTTAAPSPSTLGNTMSGSSNSSTTTTILASSSNNLTAASIPLDMAIPPPSYSETPPSYEASSSSVSVSTAAAASTSRGAAVTIPITNSASNTSV